MQMVGNKSGMAAWRMAGMAALALLLGFTAACPDRAGAAEIYVATNAAPASPYDTWATAFTNLQDALSYAKTNGVVGNTLRLAGHNFARTAGDTNVVYTLQDATNITLRGGYEGITDTPGTNNPALWTTTLARVTSGPYGRVLDLVGVSNCAIEQVTIRDADWNSAVSRQGGGVRLSACRDITFDTCRIMDNRILGRPPYGGGLALLGSSVIMTNCEITGNYIARAGGLSSAAYGGGVYVDGSSRLTVMRSMVRNNESQSGQTTGYGGGFHVASGGSLDLRETVVAANRVKYAQSGTPIGGGISSLGALALRNVLVISNLSQSAHSDGVYVGGGKAVLNNATVAYNNGVGIRYAGGGIALTNVIIWGQATDLMNFPVDGSGFLPDVWYSCSADRNNGFQGCVTSDPLFADRLTYHLQSTEGMYTNGFFSGGVWTTAATHSPLIDHGDPASDWSREPAPNGSWVNIGAYGNTEVASKSPVVVVTPPIVENPGATAWGRRTVRLRGEVTDSGGQLPVVGFEFWMAGNSDTTAVTMGYSDVLFEGEISGLTPGTEYRYRAVASNEAGAVFSAESAFVTHPVPSELFVATNGNNTAGTNWTTAYSDLRTALAIVESGDTVYLAGHAFVEAAAIGSGYIFALQSQTNVSILGGYAAESADVPGTNNPAIWTTTVGRATSGPEGRVLELSGLTNCVFAGIVIRDGYWNQSGNRYGGGVSLTDCRDIVFDACGIVGNRVLANSPFGGGLALVGSSSVTMTRCLVADNDIGRSGGSATAVYGGGAFVSSSSRLTMTGSIVRNNVAETGQSSGQGGGIFLSAGGVLDIDDTVFAGNRVTTRQSPSSMVGGAIASFGELRLRNTLVVSNQSQLAECDGIQVQAGTAVIDNSTVADNFAIGLRCAGGTIALTNTIVWGHTVADLTNFPTDVEGRLLNVSHSLFGLYHPAGAMNGASGCIVGDPLFVGAGDYRLQDRSRETDTGVSPAIDAGIGLPWMTGAKDLAGQPRMLGRVDMGAYETVGRGAGSIIIIR